MFQFRRFPSHTYLIQYGIPFGGFPHSEISGSMLICSSPKLIAAYHVLHRLLMPRHSPCALISLTDSNSGIRRNLIFQSATTFVVAILQALQKNPFLVSLSRIMQAHKEVFFSWNCISITLKILFLYCCLLIIIISSSCSVFKVRRACTSRRTCSRWTFFKGSLKSPIGDFNQPSKKVFAQRMYPLN